ncbi:MAG TPA: hypothetical protein DDW42_00690 [Desulfobacteraceae bacterium]|nr:hypothetical protein [Desulfobacteraceae bacterium]
MKLDLRFTSRTLEELWCQIVIALVFQGPIEKTGGISGLDAKTSGYLTYLWKTGFWTGASGDTLLLASQNMIKADKILLKGLGVSSNYSTEIFSKRIKEVGCNIEGMGINDIGIHIPVIKGFETDFGSQLESACVNLVDAFFIGHKDDPDFLLKIVVSIDGSFIGDLTYVVPFLRNDLDSRLDNTIIFDRDRTCTIDNS